MSAPGIVCFSHGKESGPWGTKIRDLADAARALGWGVESLDYRGMDARTREHALLQWCRAQASRPLLVGSSMGAWVALAAASQVPARGLFLLAPAVYMAGYEGTTPAPPDVPTAIVHGWRDDVVPVDNAIRYAREACCPLYLLDGDHRLTANLVHIRRLFVEFLEGV